jgi:hypothetical protein
MAYNDSPQVQVKLNNSTSTHVLLGAKKWDYLKYIPNAEKQSKQSIKYHNRPTTTKRLKLEHSSSMNKLGS